MHRRNQRGLGTKMAQLILTNTPQSGTYVLERDPQAGLIQKYTSVLVLAESLQQTLAEMLDTTRSSIIVTIAGHQLQDYCKTLQIEVTNLEEQGKPFTYDNLKAIAEKIGATAEFLLDKKVPLNVHVRMPIISSEDVVWKR